MDNPKLAKRAYTMPPEAGTGAFQSAVLFLRLAGLRIGGAVVTILLLLSAGCWIAFGRISDDTTGTSRSGLGGGAGSENLVLWQARAASCYPFPDPYLPQSAILRVTLPADRRSFYCSAPKGYYPDVRNCSRAWEPTVR
jgi:hypothetical protein